MKIRLPDGHWIEYLTEIPLCDNCGVQTGFCSPCHWLKTSGMYRPRMWGDNEGLVNRRWQMRFNRGELTESSPTMPRWETKQKLQTW